MSKTVATLLAESLEVHDVDRIFCVPGESYVGLTSALIERGSPQLIVCRHESGAGFMGIADGELTGRAGVARGLRMKPRITITIKVDVAAILLRLAAIIALLS